MNHKLESCLWDPSEYRIDLDPPKLTRYPANVNDCLANIPESVNALHYAASSVGISTVPISQSSNECVVVSSGNDITWWEKSRACVCW